MVEFAQDSRAGFRKLESFLGRTKTLTASMFMEGLRELGTRECPGSKSPNKQRDNCAPELILANSTRNTTRNNGNGNVNTAGRLSLPLYEYQSEVHSRVTAASSGARASCKIKKMLCVHLGNLFIDRQKLIPGNVSFDRSRMLKGEKKVLVCVVRCSFSTNTKRTKLNHPRRTIPNIVFAYLPIKQC